MADAVTKTPSFPVREDCWSEDATATLIEAWGERYVNANRGNIRQHHWQELADAVNNRHGLFRTDIQCKNRIDTIKKKYKVEKAIVSKSKGAYVSPWPLFQTLDGFFGSKITKMSPPTTTKLQVRAAAEDTEAPSVRKREREDDEYEEAAAAIERLGEIYERVERRKQREMVGLEKQRMQFVKELECHRMEMLAESELQIQKMKRAAAAAAAATTTTKRYSASAPTALSSLWTLLFSD